MLYKDTIYRALEENTSEVPDKDPDIWEALERTAPIWMDRYYNPDKYSVLEALTIPAQSPEYTDKIEYITNEEEIIIIDDYKIRIKEATSSKIEKILISKNINEE